jgi:hypothetical protein
MSDTPRTDKRTFKILSSLQSGTMDVVGADLARSLERELTSAHAENARLRDAMLLASERMRCTYYDYYSSQIRAEGLVPTHPSDCPKCRLEKALINPTEGAK